MRKNEATKQDDQYQDLPDSIRRLIIERDILLEDDYAFSDFLVEAVKSGMMKPSIAMYLYCKRYNMKEITLTNIDLQDGSPKPPALQFFDEMLSDGDITDLLVAIDYDREYRASLQQEGRKS
jgi:hypothetical protein